nr:hypothetical protein [Tanacetum cinerariifolium]
MKKVLKGLVKNQVKEQVSRILPRIEESVNATLEAEVLTRLSHSSKTSYAIAADLSEMELKKILIEKMEGNKSIQRSDEQRNLYKALVEAYEADKAILDTYGDSTILKRKREDDDQEGPSAGPNREVSRHQLALPLKKQPRVQANLQQDEGNPLPVYETGADDQPIVQTSQHPEWFSKLRKPPSPDRAWNTALPAAQGDAQSWIIDLAKQADARSSFNELLDTPIDFSNFIMHRLNVDTLTPDLLAGPTYKLMNGSCTSLTELEYHLEEVYKATTDQLDWVNPEGQQYPHNLLQPLPLIPDNRGRRASPREIFDCENYFSSESDCESLPSSSLNYRLQPSGRYHAVPPPTTRTFMPPKPDLVFHTAPVAIEIDHSAFTIQLSPSKPAQDLSHTNRPTAPIIEDWVKTPRHSVQPVETSIPAATPKPTRPKSYNSAKRRNTKTCFVCKSVDHLIKDCDYHAKKMAQPIPRNYAHSGNNNQNASLTHKNPQKHMVPAVVLTQSKPIYITAVRPVSATVPKIMVTRPRLAHPIITMSKSHIRWHITHSQSLKTSNSPPRVTAVQAPVVSAAQGNMSYLSEFEELNGGYVAFGGNLKGGKISGKGKIMT